MDAAIEYLLKKGLSDSTKRIDKIATEGVVATKVSDDNRSAVIVEVNIQTDFATRNNDFLSFVDKVVKAAEKASSNNVMVR